MIERKQVLYCAGFAFDTQSPDYPLIALTALESGAIGGINEISALVRGRGTLEMTWAGRNARLTSFVRNSPLENFRQERHYLGIIETAGIVNDSLELNIRSKFSHLLDVDPIMWNDKNHRARHPNDGWFRELFIIEREGEDIRL